MAHFNVLLITNLLSSFLVPQQAKHPPVQPPKQQQPPPVVVEDVDTESDDEDNIQVSPRNDAIGYGAADDVDALGDDVQQSAAFADVITVPAHHQEPVGGLAIAVVAGISAAATVGLIAFAIGWYK